MFELLNLEQLGERLGQVDRALVALMQRRMELSLQVEEYKRARNQVISRPEIETNRLNEVCKLAERVGMNPEFARSIFYVIIGESCKVQLIQLQENAGVPSKYIDDELWNALLKDNLLKLTAECAATYDLQYSSSFYGTRLHAHFEQSMLLDACRQYGGEGLALDLGCATGRVAFALGRHFSRVVGYDISPDMIEVARRKCEDTRADKFRFEAVDLDDGIPQPDGIASLVAMSLGFASDIQLLPKVMREVHRVLVPGGTALLSFYNAEALLYQWEFIPWPVGLAAEINRQKHCLDVHWTDGKVYSIYARPYTVDQVQELMPHGLAITKVTTHPTICSILPDSVCSDERVRDSIKGIDEKLAHENMGAYITVLARKS